MVWPAIIAGAAQIGSSILPKLLGGGGSHNPIKSIVGDAQKAGIHPLYALGSGMGTSSYAGPEISWGDAAGAGLDAIGRAADVWDQYNQQESDRADRNNQAEADRRWQSQRDLMERQFQKELRQPTELDRAQAELLRAQTRTELMRQRAMQIGASGGGNVSDPNTPIRLPFGNWKTEGMSPASSVENEYGDVAQEVYGIGKFIRDLGVNAYDFLSHPYSRKAIPPLRQTKGFTQP